MGKTKINHIDLENIAPALPQQKAGLRMSGGSTSSDEDESLENKRVRNFVPPMTPGNHERFGKVDLTHVQRHYDEIERKYGSIGRCFIEICKHLDEQKPTKYDLALQLFDKKADDMNLLRYKVVKKQEIEIKGKKCSYVTYQHPKNPDDRIIYLLDSQGKILKIDSKNSDNVILPPVWVKGHFEMEMKSNKKSVSYEGHFAIEKDNQPYFSKIPNMSKLSRVDDLAKKVNLGA